MRTTSEENKVLVRRFGEAMNTRQYQLLDELVAPDFRRHCQATPEVDIRSLEQFRDFLRQDELSFPIASKPFSTSLPRGTGSPYGQRMREPKEERWVNRPGIPGGSIT